jgi:hypothetical protein
MTGTNMTPPNNSPFGTLPRGVAAQQRPADFGRNLEQNLINEPRPGAFIAPEGIPFITTGSISDFPKYTSILPPTPWTAWTDPESNDNFQQYSIMVVEGDSLTIETWVVPYEPVNWTRTTQPEFISNSFTIRKTARFEDLKLMLEGAKELPRGNITQETWDLFQEQIIFAQTLTSSSAPEAIHTAYTAIYDAYYALETTTDNSALTALINEVTGILATAEEGLWAGQFPGGYIAAFTAVFDKAVHVNELRLSAQTEINEQYGLLQTAFDSFMASASTIPRPWIDVHEIPSAGVYTMGLLHWMDESIMLNMPWEAHETVWPRHFAHHTKRNFSGGSFGDWYTELINAPAFGSILRNETPFGPVNALGGRGPDTLITNAGGGHITRTHAGEWIRYEIRCSTSRRIPFAAGCN